MNYHNSTMCAEHVTFEESKFITRSIAPLTMDVIEKLPRDIVNCILGIAAVHMASRHPGNRPLERLALETKASVFHSFNNRLQSPHNQHPDVIVCCGILIFAMDLFEQGMARWMLHFLGSMNVMSSFGGMENLFTYYPHLQLPLTHVAHFETLWVILSHIPLTRPKQASRRALELLCASPDVKRRFYNPCPTILTLAVWDMGACASKLLCDPMESISNADLHMRDRIIRDILAYRPEEGAMDIKESYYKDIAFPEARLKAWNAISAAWKGAITILALRYLYFGRANLNPQAHGQHPSTPPINASTELWYTPYDEPRPYYHQSAAVPEAFSEPDGLPEYLSAGLDINDPLSRSPSPLPFLYLDPPASDIWDKRYEIHDEAFSALYSNLFSIHDNLPPVCLRYIVLPIIILALVSRPGSSERTLCLSYFGKFKDFMETNYPPDSPIDAPRSREQTQSPSPQGGENLEFDIPWDRLDAYSEVVERQKQESIHSDDGVLTKGAPEWNWWDMLRNSQLSMIWPVTCGTSHFERGSEFWAFKLISAVVNDETFTTWTSGQATPQPSSSSSYF
ncbi:hypothetical protein EJ04DRAFT_58091 [Polyplosphaeria fusca]|uniref:Uncharacterized protein n=1 Tax=Polyplosphaeria fusca TaxID=682080 RepID=A0A9P4QS16_9PLEO|nr:hypothetical protein EJ04DRAFT_58091 [Polyplosphaeria fusca]